MWLTMHLIGHYIHQNVSKIFRLKNSCADEFAVLCVFSENEDVSDVTHYFVGTIF